MSLVDSLMEMGFPRNRAEKALKVTGDKGVAVAMDWLFAHIDDPDIDEPFVEPVGHRLDAPAPAVAGAAAGAAGSAGTGETAADDDAAQPETAASLRCEQCDKQLRDADAAQAHATRTGHTQFSESVEAIKPLTEEERTAQKARLQQMMQEKRAQRLEREKQEEIESEKVRRRSGRDVGDAKAKYDEQQRRLDAQQRRREAADAKRAKDDIMAKVAADKAARAAAKSAKAAETTTTATPASVGPRPEATSSAAPPVKKQYTTSRIRVRLSDGRSIQREFGAADCFSVVMAFVQEQHLGSFALKSAQPPRMFGAGDMDRTLKDLDLVPSATLMVVQQ